MVSSFENLIDFIRSLYNNQTGVIPLHEPCFKGNEKNYLFECVDSTFVSSVGKFVDQFEDEIAKYIGVKKAVSCVNGTSALHLALKLIGVKPGHEVITQPLTFVATANAITYCGANPVFVDVDKDTLGLSPESLEKFLKTNSNQQFNKLTKTKECINKATGNPISACIPMHTFGHPCRIDEIVKICNYQNIPVIEDDAESLGSVYKGKHTGTFGRIGILSFNGNKILTTGGGGMLLFQDEELAKRARHLTTQAKVPHPWNFEHDKIGYNYRMPNINSALGLAQLEQLPFFLQNKRETAEKYRSFFQSTPWEFFTEPNNARSNYWMNIIFFNSLEERNKFLKYSHENGVLARPAWKLMNELWMYRKCQTADLQNSIYISDRLVNIPSSVRI